MEALQMGKANLDVFAATVLKLAQENRDVLVVTGDSRGSGKLTGFGEALPEQLVEIGIAEQNLVGVSAGLASAGKQVFAVSPACFLTARALEQIKNDVAYSNNPVHLVGISAGVSYGALGSTHHSLHDLAALQAIHNLDIVVPADNYETEQAVRAAIEHPRPLYLRFGKKAMPHLPAPDAPFEIGKARLLRGVADRAAAWDVLFLATGEAVAPAWLACDQLDSQGLACGLLSLHTIKPLDRQAVLEAATRSRAVVTAEEHSVYGGLGSTVAALLMQAGVFRPLKIIGIPDEEMVTGSQEQIFSHFGITASGLADEAQQLLEMAGSPVA